MDGDDTGRPPWPRGIVIRDRVSGVTSSGRLGPGVSRLTDHASLTTTPFGRSAAPQNERMQQTRSAMAGMDAALAADPRCSPDPCGLGLRENGDDSRRWF